MLIASGECYRTIIEMQCGCNNSKYVCVCVCVYVCSYLNRPEKDFPRRHTVPKRSVLFFVNLHVRMHSQQICKCTKLRKCGERLINLRKCNYPVTFFHSCKLVKSTDPAGIINCYAPQNVRHYFFTNNTYFHTYIVIRRLFSNQVQSPVIN